jgi:hypothetical protein
MKISAEQSEQIEKNLHMSEEIQDLMESIENAEARLEGLYKQFIKDNLTMFSKEDLNRLLDKSFDKVREDAMDAVPRWKVFNEAVVHTIKNFHKD